jgi:nucleoside-diphosphate-sugar epimerase
MPSEPASVLITGANGFVGARLCHRFLQEGFHTIAGVRRSSDLKPLDGLKLEFRYGDITDDESLPALVRGVDYIVHNAGLTKARRAEALFRVNEGGTVRLMEAIAEHNPQVRKVVYISSLAAAGPIRDGRPVTEEDPPQPITTYGRSKLAGERAALSFTAQFPVVALRPPGVYGPGDREIFSFFQTVYRGIKPLLGDTDRRMQLVHVDDLSRAVFLAMVGEGAKSGSYFIAEDRSYSMSELIDLLQKACGKSGFALKLPAGLFRAVAAVSEMAFKAVGGTPMLTREKANELLASWEVATDKARQDFDFRSRIPFADGARETFAWYLRNGWL